MEFKYGQINTINGTVFLVGSNARIADAGAANRNSALAGLHTVAGELLLFNGASVSTYGNLSITGSSSEVEVTGSGASLTIGGNLSNAGQLVIGSPYVAGGTVKVYGPGGITNTGSIDIAGGSLTSRALNGTGAVTVEYGGALEFGRASSASVTFGSGSNTLKLDDSRRYSGTLSGLSNSDKVDLADLFYRNGHMSAKYSGTASGGTLTLSNGFTSVRLALSGDYTSSTWTLSSDGRGGTNVVDPASSPGGSSLVAQASSNAVSVPAASQNSQTSHALLTQYAASSFAPAGGGATVVAAPHVAATPLLASPHHI